MRRLSMFVALCALAGLFGPVLGSEASAALPAEPYQHLQWGLDDVRAPEAWQHATGAVDPQDGEPVVVAVVDTGVDKDHPEFAGRLTEGASWWNCPAGQPAPCTAPSAWDGGYHGSHVAGVIAAPRNGVGIAGVAPESRIMPLRAIGVDGPESLFAVGDAIRYAVDHGADVINLSLGWITGVHNVGAYAYGWAPAVKYALDHDVAVVMAAGNFFSPLCDNEYGPLADVLCVGSLDRNGARPFYSNWGAGVDVFAPGGDGTCESGGQILSTLPLGGVPQCPAAPGQQGYGYMAGTSMATPHAAGVAALLAEQGIRGRDAIRHIQETADDLGPLFGHGAVNAERAVTTPLGPGGPLG